MAYIEVKIPASVTLPEGQTSVTVDATVRFMAQNGIPDTTTSGLVDLGSMNPDFCDVHFAEVYVTAGGVGRVKLTCIPLIPQHYPDGNWYCDVMISAQTQDGAVMGGSPNMHIKVPAPPQAATRLVQVRAQGQIKGGPVPVPFDVLVDGTVVFQSSPSNPIGGGWGQW